MPPISVIGANASTWDAPGGALSVAPPSKAKKGDTLLLAIALASAAAVVTSIGGSSTFDGWTLVQTITTANNRVYLFRRDISDELAEPVAHTAAFTAATNGQAALIALRGVLNPMPAAGAANDSIATTNHVMPSQTLPVYSGMWLGLVMCTSGALPVAPVGVQQHLNVTDGTRIIAVFSLLPEATGATGTKTATTGTNRTGVAVSFEVDALPAVGVGLSFAFDPVGVPGLPSEGI